MLCLNEGGCDKLIPDCFVTFIIQPQLYLIFR